MQVNSQIEQTSTPKKLRVAFFASGRGTDMRAIIQAIDEGKLNVKPVLLVSNKSGKDLNPDESAMKYVQDASPIPFDTLHISNVSGGVKKTDEEVDALICKALEEYQIDIVVMCGYMRQIGPQALQANNGKVVFLNVHPSDLPDLAGYHGDEIFKMHAERRRNNLGNPKYYGAVITVHLVDEKIDHGEHIRKAGLMIGINEDWQHLKDRMQNLEGISLIQILQDFASGILELGKESATSRR